MPSSRAVHPTAATALVLTFSVLVFFLVASAHGAERTRESFNRDWRFTRDDPVGLTMALDYAAARRWLQPMGAELLNGADHATAWPTKNPGTA